MHVESDRLLEKWQNGQHAEAARARIAALERAEEERAHEAAEWSAVAQTTEIEKIEAFLGKWPKGQHAKEARALSKILDLQRQAAEARAAEQRAQETARWFAIAEGPDKKAIEAFLERWPNGQYAEAAQARIAELEREAAEARAAARARIAALEREAAETKAAEQQRPQENAEWGAVAASTDREAIQAFPERWPNGQHAEAAGARIADLLHIFRVRAMLLGTGAIGAALVFAWVVAYHWGGDGHGARGDPGPRGPAGPPGPQGPAGPPGLAGFRFAEFVCQAECSASCEQNERLVNALAPNVAGTFTVETDRAITYKPPNRGSSGKLVLVCKRMF